MAKKVTAQRARKEMIKHIREEFGTEIRDVERQVEKAVSEFRSYCVLEETIQRGDFMSAGIQLDYPSTEVPTENFSRFNHPYYRGLFYYLQSQGFWVEFLDEVEASSARVANDKIRVRLNWG